MNGVAECSRANSSMRAAVSAGIGTARRRAAREEYVLAAPGSSSGSGSEPRPAPIREIGVR